MLPRFLPVKNRRRPSKFETKIQFFLKQGEPLKGPETLLFSQSQKVFFNGFQYLAGFVALFCLDAGMVNGKISNTQQYGSSGRMFDKPWN